MPSAMTAVTQNNASLLHPGVSQSRNPEVLADIYAPQNNIVIWERDLDSELVSGVAQLLGAADKLKIEGDVSPASTYAFLYRKLEDLPAANIVCEEIAQLVDMFCCLFDLKDAGLRLTMLEHAMCPRFHVDRVPCRLVTTFQGAATQWLPHECVDRSRLGHGTKGLPDEASGIYQQAAHIRQLSPGDVALLKGELWEGNENAGLVHRSPSLKADEKRLLLTLDFIG